MAAAILDLFHLLPPQAAKFLETQAVRAGLVWMSVLANPRDLSGACLSSALPWAANLPETVAVHDSSVCFWASGCRVYFNAMLGRLGVASTVRKKQVTE